MNTVKISEEQLATARDDIYGRSSLPAWTDVHHAARRRRVRDRSAVAVAGVLAVAVGVTAGAAIVSEPRTKGVPAAAVPAARVPSAAGICYVYPVDSQRSFAVFPAAGACEPHSSYLYGRTLDAGKTWQVLKIPDGWRAGDEEAPMFDVLTADTVVVGGLISHDAGESWQKLAPVGADVTAVPDGWMVLAMQNQKAPAGTMMTIDPKTGERALLTGVPAAIINEKGGISQSLEADGSLWLQGSVGGVGKGWISRDRGRSWDPVKLPAAHQSAGIGRLVSRDGTVGYAHSFNRGEKAKLFRTDDGGQHWELVAEGIKTLYGRIEIGPGNVVLASANSGLQISHDGGRTFTAVKPPVSGAVFQNAAGTLYLHDGFAASTDGLHFTPIRLPSA